jgi:hypothetical protein
MSKKESLIDPQRCFVCQPSPLPEPYCRNTIQGPKNEAFMAGLAYGTVILAYCEEGSGLCEFHRGMVLQGLDAITEALEELYEEDVAACAKTPDAPPVAN